MAYFHSKWSRSRGGRRARLMRRVVGETLEEMQSVSRRWVDSTAINWPPTGVGSHKSKSLPMLWVDADRMDILAEIDSAEVSDDHICVLTWLLRAQWYQRRSGVGMPEDVEKFFQREIRGNLIRLLRNGSWIDHPENLGLKNLNSKLEKIDLGRRSDLNFSSQQSWNQKFQSPRYNPQFRKSSSSKILEVEASDLSDNEIEYRDATKESRKRILQEKPWLSYLRDKYGE